MISLIFKTTNIFFTIVQRKLGLPTDTRGDTSANRKLVEAQATAREQHREGNVQGHDPGKIHPTAAREKGDAVLRDRRSLLSDRRKIRQRWLGIRGDGPREATFGKILLKIF